MPLFFGRLYRRMGTRYFLLFVAFEVMASYLICWATVGMFALYTEMSSSEFWRITAFAEACVAVALTYVIVKSWRLGSPVIDWVKQGKPREGALEAWRTAVALPRDFVASSGWQPFVLIAVPIAVVYTLEFELPAYSGLIIFGGSVVAVAYAAVLHFFASEVFLRPVVEDAARLLPPDFAGERTGVPLRWKLLGALPVINVVTGVVVSGLSTDGTASLDDLGVDVLVALLVSFTISLELTVLVTKSLMRPIDDLLAATERVKQGRLDARVPLTSADEMGALAGSFNEMMQGLTEREQLRGAFGSYVDPEVAERVLEEGELIEGQDREVTVLFVDVRDFTPFAERSSARETVAFLNEFFDLLVPVIRRHGGHANKFLGDGLLAVFGAPERLDDHADRGLAAACEIASQVERRFEGRVRVGIGLNSGPVVVGSVGGGGRLEFTVIGDPVNVAARVEECTKQTGDVVLLTESTRALLNAHGPELEERGEAVLRGKSDAVPVYAPRLDLDARTRGDRRPLRAEA